MAADEGQLPRAPAVGIDFGTSQSCVGVYYNGRVVIVENDWANSSMPSCVAFTNSERLVGEPARSQMTANPTNTVTASKRLLGRSGYDPAIPMLTRHWPVEVSTGGARARLRVEHKAERKTFLPEEMCSLVVSKLKRTVESFLGKQVTDVVVTVPSCSNHLLEKALVDACTYAGLNVRRVLDDCSAGALTHAHNTLKSGPMKGNMLVVDVGAGHVSASVVTVEDGIVEVVAKSGSSRIGGEDFTGRLVDYVTHEFATRYRKDVFSSSRTITRIRRACELAKRELSSLTETLIELDDPLDDLDRYHTVINRDTFEQINHDLFQGVIALVSQTIAMSGFGKSTVDEVLLLGDSTKIPKLQSLLQEALPHLEIGKSIKPCSVRPSEASAFGATLQAAVLQGYEIDDLLLVDCMWYSIGVELAGGEMCVLTKHNRTIPYKRTECGFTTQCDNQPVVLFKVFRGDRLLTRDNTYLGQFALTGIPSAPRGTVQIELTVNVVMLDRLSITIKALESSSGRRAEITLTGDPAPAEGAEGYRDIVPTRIPQC